MTANPKLTALDLELIEELTVSPPAEAYRQPEPYNMGTDDEPRPDAKYTDYKRLGVIKTADGLTQAEAGRRFAKRFGRKVQFFWTPRYWVAYDVR